MYPNVLLTLAMTLVMLPISWGQTAPFHTPSKKHSSFYGKVAEGNLNYSIFLSDAKASSKNIHNHSVKENDVASSSLIDKLYDAEGNVLTQLDVLKSQTKGGDLVRITVLFDNQGFDCKSDLILTMGTDEFKMKHSQMNLFLPKGRYYYKVTGEMNCKNVDGSTVEGHGIIDVEGASQLELKWQLVDYQKSWMTFHYD